MEFDSSSFGGKQLRTSDCTHEVVKKIKADFDDPNEFDELVDAWRSLCERSRNETSEDLKFADIEKAAIAALSTTPREPSADHIGHDISRMLNSFDYPTYLVTSDGYVAASNLCAWKEFSLEVNDPINELPFQIEGSEDISQLISSLVRKKTTNSESTLLLKRAHASLGQLDATIAITVSFGQIPTALVFVITTRWKHDSVNLLKRQYGLTRAEAEILISFVDGYSSQDIAKQRSRSHQTVRAQFQSIREKLGVRNQTDLLRTTLSVSGFTSGIGSITNAVEHPHRRKSENIRQGGRVVEATLMGDFTGDPIVTIAAISQYTFNAEFEQLLFDANLVLISICPPGYGKTDPTPKGISWIDQTADDMLAVLDQLHIPRCILLIKYTNAPMSYRIASLHPDRFSHIVQLSTCGPAVYDKPSKGRSTWISGTLKACLSNSAIAGILVRGYIKSMATIGAGQFMRLQMSSNPVDAKYALLAQNIAESQHAIDTATRRGISGAVEEHELAFGDWSADIECVETDITFIHGRKNKLFTIESVRSLASLFPDKINLIEVEDAGFTVVLSHPKKVVEILRSVVNAYSIVSDRSLDQLQS